MATPWTAPRLWPAATVAVLAPGPSLQKKDVDALQGRVPVICVGNTHELAPWAPVLYHHDAQWWKQYEGVPSFAGLKVTMDENTPFEDVKLLKRTQPYGFDPDPACMCHGSNSGYQAVHLAVHLGAARIVLLGFDMWKVGGKSHYHGDYPDPIQSESPFKEFRARFWTLWPELRKRGVKVFNCSPDSWLTGAVRRPIEEVLAA